MKKFLPVILLLVGIVAVGASVFFILKGKRQSNAPQEEDSIPEIELSMRPYVNLTPSEDGHWLKLSINKIVINASTLEYDLEYNLPNGTIQGTGGEADLNGEDFERDLLLGTESSGKFYYYEGVEKGTLTIRFRDGEGKTMAKFTSEFVLVSTGENLTSADKKMTFEFEDETEGYFVVMKTIGYPSEPPSTLTSEIYGIFTSGDNDQSGTINIEGSDNYYSWPTSNGSGAKLQDGLAEKLGAFAGI